MTSQLVGNFPDIFISTQKKKKIFMLINYVNADHVHILIDLPTDLSIMNAVKLLKGSSSHWINKNRITSQPFGWSRGYAAFLVSKSASYKVKSYIRNQEEHHRSKTFTEELDEFLKRHNFVSIDR